MTQFMFLIFVWRNPSEINRAVVTAISIQVCSVPMHGGSRAVKRFSNEMMNKRGFHSPHITEADAKVTVSTVAGQKNATRKGSLACCSPAHTSAIRHFVTWIIRNRPPLFHYTKPPRVRSFSRHRARQGQPCPPSSQALESAPSRRRAAQRRPAPCRDRRPRKSSLS